MKALSPVLPNPIRESGPVLRTRIPVLRTRICECYTLWTENGPVLREKFPVLRVMGANPGACIIDAVFDILCKGRDHWLCFVIFLQGP